ncbi:MAG: serine hydrolase [Candidatus Delongbacteria bacterium]|nr:serine hydrolase [Candidatus Delongbacteria bacterium]
MKFKISIILLKIILNISLFSRELNVDTYQSTESKIFEFEKVKNIPELTLVLITEDNEILNNFDYTVLRNIKITTSKINYELGSTSKAFTALAVLNLEKEGMLDQNDSISIYIPWLQFKYKDKIVDITLSHLIHQTNGIPWNTICSIQKSNKDNSLEQTIQNINGIELSHELGSKFEYTTINYDILGLIIEKVSEMSYEKYMEENIFKPLGLNNTSIGITKDKDLMSKGYKIGIL